MHYPIPVEYATLATYSVHAVRVRTERGQRGMAKYRVLLKKNGHTLTVPFYTSIHAPEFDPLACVDVLLLEVVTVAVEGENAPEGADRFARSIRDFFGADLDGAFQDVHAYLNA